MPKTLLAEAIHSTATIGTLPAPVTPLLGRSREIAAIRAMLDTSEIRLVTLTGAGGIGKTRLALHAAGRLASDFADGVAMVQLAGVDDAGAVPVTLAEGLGLPLEAAESVEQQLFAFLREKHLLIVVDNFEQVTAAAELLARVAAHAPRVRILVTTRIRLGIAAETSLPLDGPPYAASARDLDRFASTRLFVESARRVDSRFRIGPQDAEYVSRICRFVEGVPLALELAGGCTALLPCAAIADELEQSHDLVVGARADMPARHRSLRAAFDSSWRLLDEDEQRAFARLSVFRSGFDRHSAQAVAAADLRLVGRLVDKSLVRRGIDDRFEILEQLRQCADEKLAANKYELDATRQLHCDYFVGSLEALVGDAAAPGAQTRFARLAERVNDVRAAWSWAASERRLIHIERGVHGLYLLYEGRGWAAEAMELLGRAVVSLRSFSGSAAEAARAGRIMARVMARQGAVASQLGRSAEARELLTEAAVLLRAAGEPSELAFTLNRLCGLARAAGEYEDGAELAEQSLELYRSVGDTAGVAGALNSLGSMRYGQGRYDEARRHFEESIALYRSIGECAEIWQPLNNLSGIALLERNFDEAGRLLEENLRMARERSNLRGAGVVLHNLGYASYRAGRLDVAEGYLRDSIVLNRAQGFRDRLSLSLHVLAAVLYEAGESVAADAADREALTIAAEIENVPLVLETLAGMARQRLRAGDTGAASALLHALHLHPACDAETRQDVESLLQELGDRPAPNAHAADLDAVIAGVLRPAG